MSTVNGYCQNGDNEEIKHKKMEKLSSGLIMSKPNNFDDMTIVADFVRAKTQYQPTVGIICGSGLGKIVNQIHNPDIIPYEKIPGFPVSTVVGHKGNLVFGILQGRTVMCMQGRIHPYEGYSFELCAMPVRLMYLLGVKTLIATNAAGSLNRTYHPGDLMLIKDHLYMPGFAGASPLHGVNDERFGPRFPSMNNAYDKELRLLVKDVAKRIGISLQEGVYALMGGPQFETPAENRLLKALGADVVGMSTAHEVIVARHCGIKCIGFSLVTNLCELDSDCGVHEVDIHEEVLKTGNEVAEQASHLVAQIVKRL